MHKQYKVAVSENGSDVLPTAKWTTQEELNAFNTSNYGCGSSVK